LLIGFRKEDDKAPAHVTVRLDRGDDPSADGPSAERFEIRQQRLPHRGVVDTLSSNLLDVADAEEVCELFVALAKKRRKRDTVCGALLGDRSRVFVDGQRNGVGELVTSHGAEDWVRREPALLVLPPERLEQATIRAQPSAKLAWVEAGQRAQDGRWQLDVRCRVANRTSNGGYVVQDGGVASEHVHEPMMRVLRLTHLAHPQDHGGGPSRRRSRLAWSAGASPPKARHPPRAAIGGLRALTFEFRRASLDPPLLAAATLPAVARGSRLGPTSHSTLRR